MDQISEHRRRPDQLGVDAVCHRVRRLPLPMASIGSRGTLSAVEPDVARMKEVLEEGKDPVTAEPLYMLLALPGPPDAHEQAGSWRSSGGMKRSC